MTVKDKKVKVYLRKIRKMIPGGKAKEQILEQTGMPFRSALAHPQQVAEAYIEGMEPDEILVKFKKKKIIVGVVVGAVVLALTAWFTVVIAAWIE